MKKEVNELPGLIEALNCIDRISSTKAVTCMGLNLREIY